MNKYVELNAPIYKIDGIPAFKAGEWPGLKSNKFENTRKMIKAIEKGIFFSENEPLKKPRHKTFEVKKSSEYKFKPCMKKITPIDTRTPFQLGEGLYPSIPSVCPFLPRYYDFQKIEDYHQRIVEERNKIINENKIMNKNKTDGSSIAKGGFTKEFYDNISNNKLLGITFNKELYYSYKNKKKTKKYVNEFIKFNSNKRKLEEIKRAMSIKNEQENLKKDINYVNSL